MPIRVCVIPDIIGVSLHHLCQCKTPVPLKTPPHAFISGLHFGSFRTGGVSSCTVCHLQPRPLRSDLLFSMPMSLASRAWSWTSPWFTSSTALATTSVGTARLGTLKTWIVCSSTRPSTRCQKYGLDYLQQDKAFLRSCPPPVPEGRLTLGPSS